MIRVLGAYFDSCRPSGIGRLNALFSRRRARQAPNRLSGTLPSGPGARRSGLEDAPDSVHRGAAEDQLEHHPRRLDDDGDDHDEDVLEQHSQ